MSGVILNEDGVTTYEEPLADSDPALTPHEQARRAMKRRRVEKSPTLRLRVQSFPEEFGSWSIEYRLLATSEEFQQIQKQAKSSKDEFFANRLILARCCIGLYFNGEQLAEDNGNPMTFGSKSLSDILDGDGVTTLKPHERVTALFRGGIMDGPGDGEINAHANAIAREAGFLDHEVWREYPATP